MCFPCGGTMRRKPLSALGLMVRERRGDRTLRQAAVDVGIGPATLLRVESGRVPDVDTFGKLCRWLKVDPGVFLGKPAEPKAELVRDTGLSVRVSVGA